MHGKSFSHFSPLAVVNKSDSIWGPCGTRNEQLEQNPSSKVSKVSVKTSRSMGEREKQLEERQRASLVTAIKDRIG